MFFLIFSESGKNFNIVVGSTVPGEFFGYFGVSILSELFAFVGMIEEISDLFRDELRSSGRYQEPVAGTRNHFPSTSDISGDDRLAAEGGFGDGSR